MHPLLVACCDISRLRRRYVDARCTRCLPMGHCYLETREGSGDLDVLTTNQCIHSRGSLHRRLRLCPTLGFPPAAADLFISSSSNPASIRIFSTSSKIGLYSAMSRRGDPESARTTRNGNWWPRNKTHRIAPLQERTRPFEEVSRGCRWCRTLSGSSVHLGIRH